MVLSRISTEQTTVRIQVPDRPDHLTEWNTVDVTRRVDWLKEPSTTFRECALGLCSPRKASRDVSALTNGRIAPALVFVTDRPKCALQSKPPVLDRVLVGVQLCAFVISGSICWMKIAFQ